ncbi:MAG: insulinase family protein, partial [Paludibacter sp.]|nr:insulinase family protein [Paludibacter sp.]
MKTIIALKRLLAGAILGAGLLISPATAMSAEAESLPIAIDPRIQEFTLENGWKFIVLPRHETPVVSFYTWADVGSAQEVKGITGSAHLLEHLAFKGTQNIGTTDYEKEQPALAKIDEAYQALQREKAKGPEVNPDQLKKLTEDFRAAQEEAGKYVVQNEFGTAVELYGGRGLNASTSSDRTDYFFSLPSNAAEL